MAVKLLRLACCVLACLAVTSGQKTPIRDVLQQKGHTKFLELAKVAGITEPASSALLTIFAPTNQAIDSFLKSMKLTVDDVKANPALAAAVVGYHVLPRIKGKIADVKGTTRSEPLQAITADGDHFLKFFMGPRDKEVIVEDVQNNTASILAAGTEVGNVIIYPIDRVMLSGDVFTTLAALLSLNPQFRPLKKLYEQAGLEGEVQAMQGQNSTLTIFAPTAEAVKSAEPQLSKLSKAELQDVLRYHIVPAALPIPAGLQADKAYPTAFKGHNLKFKYNKVDEAATKASGSNSSGPHAAQRALGQTVTVVPEDGTFGSKAVAGVTVPKVNIANLFANRMIIHGISQVLKPNLPKSPPALAAPKPNSTGRKLFMKLLQFRTGTGPSVVSTSLTATQNSIRAAVDGRTDVATAAAVGGATANAATHRCWNCVVGDPFQRTGH